MRIIRLCIALGLTTSLSGCFCWGCFVPLGDYPTPLKEVESWERPGTLADTRLADWQACGGNANGTFSKKPKENFDGEEIRQAYKRQIAEQQICLINKGYHYIGKCWNDYWKSMPACDSQ